MWDAVSSLSFPFTALRRRHPPISTICQGVETRSMRTIKNSGLDIFVQPTVFALIDFIRVENYVRYTGTFLTFLQADAIIKRIF